MDLRGKLVRLRRLTADDVDGVVAVMQDPTVERWWGKYDQGKVVAEMIEDDEAFYFAVEWSGSLAGVIAYSEEDDPMYRHAAIDIALAERFQGRGIGPDAIRTLASHLFDGRGHHRLTIDPAEANVNAIKAYERVGFQRVGVMRQYERGLDGTFHNGMLMDMLAGELRE